MGLVVVEGPVHVQDDDEGVVPLANAANEARVDLDSEPCKGSLLWLAKVRYYSIVRN
jgi:hypothetical protein